MAKIDSNLLRKELHIGKCCYDCPRYIDDEEARDHCKGHLQWMCMAITKCELSAYLIQEMEKNFGGC